MLRLSNYTLNQYKNQRHHLVKILRKKGISDEKVLEAISYLPRELYVKPSFINRAYEDTALPIDCSQTISQPYTVAFMTSLLNIKHNDKILEIGTGSGYQASLLYMLGAKVYSIERIQEILDNTKNIFKEIGVKITTRLGDGSLGWSEFEPYNGIIVTAGAPFIPKKLKEQLAIGGKLIIPIGEMDSQTMYIITRISETEFEELERDRFKFVPLIGKDGWQNGD